MPVLVWELTGREFTLGEGRVEDQLQYFVTGAFTEPEVQVALMATVPPVFNNLFFLTTTATEEGYGFWRGTAHYGIPQNGTLVPNQLNGTSPPPPPPPGQFDALGPEWSVDFTGGTQKVVTSKQTKQKETGAGFVGTPPDNARAIGASKKGVEGCDVVVPRFELSTTRKMKQLSLYYLATIRSLTGKTNNADWLTVFKRGEVLYLGATVNYRSDEGWSLVHKFSVGENKTGNPNAGSCLDRVSPNAHDYVWVVFEDVETGGFKIPQPVSCYVERVYDEGNFNLLGL